MHKLLQAKINCACAAIIHILASTTTLVGVYTFSCMVESNYSVLGVYREKKNYFFSLLTGRVGYPPRASAVASFAENDRFT